MKKVLIVSYSFAPASNMGAKRYGTMCRYFEKNGYKPYVITALKEHMDTMYGLEVPISSKQIIKIKVNQNNILCISIILKLFDKLKLFSRTVNSSLFWYKNIKEDVDLEQLRTIKFDVVIGTYGPMANLVAAKYLAKKLRCKYVIDLRDLISDYNERPQGYRRTFKLDYMIEKKMLCSAAGIMTVNPIMTEDMRKRYPRKKVITVYNGWDGEQPGNMDVSSRRYLYFAGTIYEYMLESLRLLFKALKVVNEREEIEMLIRCTNSNVVKVKKLIREMKVQDIVSCLPPVNESTVREERQKAYINVVLNSIYKKDYESMVVISGKTYEYMHERAPVLAITLKESNLAKVLHYTDKGAGTDIESEIVEFILYAEGKFEGNNHVLKFSREHQAAKLCRFLDFLIKKYNT